MYKKLMSMLLGGTVVSLLFEPHVGFTMLAATIIVFCVTGIYRVFNNRTRPLPEIKIAKKKTDDSMLAREMNFMADRYQEKAESNGYEGVEDIPEKLKI